MKKICVLGGGTAGWITASYLKTFYKDRAEIVVIYDHARPSIGVGESTTPLFINFLKHIGIDYKDLMRDIGSTVKCGIKFTNWNGDNEYYYHNFVTSTPSTALAVELNLVAAYEIANNIDDGAETHSNYMCDNRLVPVDANGELEGSYALHIDGKLFSQYIRDKFKDKVTIIDGIVCDVNIENDCVKSLTLNDGNIISADIFIDASGMNSFLLPKLGSEFIQKRDHIITDSAIAVQIPHDNTNLPPYTESIATPHGWIWKIPLKDRYGIGYVYSTLCTSDETAISELKQYVFNNHNISIDIDCLRAPIRFVSGYYEKQWIGNCVAVGLSSGFVEPLEATNIHQIMTQVILFTRHYDIEVDQIIEWDRDKYNNDIRGLYEQIYQVIELHYCSNREDTLFWKKIKHLRHTWLKKYIEKCNNSFIISEDVYHNWDRILSARMFSLSSWTRITHGMKLFNSNTILNWLNKNEYYDIAKNAYEEVQRIKQRQRMLYISHDEYLKNIRK